MYIVDFFFIIFTYPATCENERISHILNIWYRKRRSRSRRREIGLTAFDRKCLIIYCWFFIILTSDNIKTNDFTHFKHLKLKMSRSTILAMTRFDGKCWNLQTSFLRPERTKVTYTHTETARHTYTETDKPIAIGEMLQICLKITSVVTWYGNIW